MKATLITTLLALTLFTVKADFGADITQFALGSSYGTENGFLKAK